MKKIIKEALPLERFTLPRNEAIEFMKEKEEPYKVELIEDLPEDAEVPRWALVSSEAGTGWVADEFLLPEV